MLEEVAGQGAVCVASDGAATGSDDFDWRKAAINLAMREACYRLNHDVHGDGSLEAGRSWDRMRHSGDAIRAAALRIHPAKDDTRALLETLRDYVADAASGHLSYRGSGEGVRLMAAEDLARIDAYLERNP